MTIKKLNITDAVSLPHPQDIYYLLGQAEIKINEIIEKHGKEIQEIKNWINDFGKPLTIEELNEVVNRIQKRVDVVQDKWEFCPNKKCFKCGLDLSNVDYKEDIVTRCHYCHTSFLE